MAKFSRAVYTSQIDIEDYHPANNFHSVTNHMKEQRSSPTMLDRLGHPVSCDQLHEGATQ